MCSQLHSDRKHNFHTCIHTTHPIIFMKIISGMPLHSLTLKIGACVMLLRNLSVKHGLCNGTRMTVQELNLHSIKCRLITSGRSVAIPRIDVTEADTRLPFKLVRRQFPVRVCYSMTIAKSQGQTFEHVGIDLRLSVFMHGMLYVALSRCRRADNVKVLLPPNSRATKNVVFKELLNI